MGMEQHGRLVGKRTGEDDLLRIAPRELGDLGVGRAGPHVEAPDQVDGTVDRGEVRDAVEEQQRVGADPQDVANAGLELVESADRPTEGVRLEDRRLSGRARGAPFRD